MASLYYDYRLGGIPRAIFGDARKALMRVPDDLLKCTTFICVNDGTGFQPGGTAFFISVPSTLKDRLYTYLVTAKHCVIEAKEKYGELFIRLNLRDGQFQFIKIDTEWIYPEDPSVDLAVLPIGLNTQYVDVKFLDYTMVATDEVIAQHGIGIGDDVVIAGLFTRRYGQKKNIPIVRIGNIAAMPDEPLPDSKTGLAYHAYLIEARSIGGLSGSPVCAYLGPMRPTKEGALNMQQNFLFLIGVIRGHWDHEEPKWKTQIDFVKELEQVNMGIATATPISELHKIIFGEKLVEGRKQHDARGRKEMDATRDSDFPDKGITKQEFEEALKKASRKIEPTKS